MIIALRCQEGDLRLTGESSTNQGRVEICADETWGTISSTTWGHLDALTTMRFHVTCTESNWCTLTWIPPPILHYQQLETVFINCSTRNKFARRDDWTALVTHTSLHVWLQPHQTYNCCVAAVNNAGRGNSICQTIITRETGTKI